MFDGGSVLLPPKAAEDHVYEEDKSNHSLGLPGKAPLTINE